jgi:hypothetical protein
MRHPALFCRFAVAGALAIALAACGGKDGGGITADTSSPDGAVMQSMQHLRRNDVGGLLAASVPPARLAQMQQAVMSKMKSAEPTDEERAEFAENFGRLIAPGAEAQLMAEIRPQLEEFNGEMKAQLPMMIGMGKSMVIATINESEDVPAENKPQATNLINAIGTWLETGEFASVRRAEQAIAAITAAARKSSIRTLDDVHALDFDGLTKVLSVALEGTKNALKAYDIDLDRTLDSARAEVVKQDGDTATVRTHFELFGTPLHYDCQMVRVDGNWYDKSTLENLDPARIGG